MSPSSSLSGFLSLSYTRLVPLLSWLLRSAAPWSSPRKTDRALASLRGSCCLHSSRRSPGPLPLLPNMLPLSTGNGYEHEVCHVAHPYRETYMARSEENKSELQALMRRSYAVFCLKKNRINNKL